MAGDALVVFAREPVPGRVKTRLAKEIGAESSARVYQDLLRLTLDVARSSDATRFLCLPEGDRLDVADGAFTVRPQVGADLGDRMNAAFCDRFAEGFGRVLLIGSDCPTLSPAILGRAYAALDQSQTVFGPARDGGYYLVGQVPPARDLFSGIPWSSPQVWELTRSRLMNRGWSFATLEVLEDIDDLDSLHRYQNETGETLGSPGK